MKRGGFVRRRKPMNKVSAKVKRERADYDLVYRIVDERAEGRCEVALSREPLFTMGVVGPNIFFRCSASATEHHHTRKPRRVWHSSTYVIAICRRHHDMTTAAYRTGRLTIEPLGDGAFQCAVVTKDGKYA